MGLIRTAIQISNPRDSTILPVEVRALVDTGAMHLCVPEHVALQLRLEQSSEREVTTADGHKRLVPYVGPVEVLPSVLYQWKIWTSLSRRPDRLW